MSQVSFSFLRQYHCRNCPGLFFFIAADLGNNRHSDLTRSQVLPSICFLRCSSYVRLKSFWIPFQKHVSSQEIGSPGQLIVLHNLPLPLKALLHPALPLPLTSGLSRQSGCFLFPALSGSQQVRPSFTRTAPFSPRS
mgnify:CR=1 FL=1